MKTTEEEEKVDDEEEDLNQEVQQAIKQYFVKIFSHTHYDTQTEGCKVQDERLMDSSSVIR